MKTNGFQLQLVENDEIGILLSCSNFTDQVIWSKSVSDQSDPSRLSASALYFASGKIQRFSNAHFKLQVSFEMQLFKRLRQCLGVLPKVDVSSSLGVASHEVFVECNVLHDRESARRRFACTNGCVELMTT